MDPNNQAAAPLQPQVSGISPISPSPKINWLVSFLFLIFGILIGASGLWGYQNYLVKKTPVSITSPTPTPSPDPTANWKTYFDPNGLYTFRYPANYSLGHYGSDNSPLLLNNRIDWGVTQHPAGGCMGDCPIVTNTQKVTTGGYSAILYEGWVGSIGGETPQSYTKYEIKHPSTDNYFVMTLWELDRTSEAQKNYSQERKIGVISEDDKKIFDQILSTFKFLGQGL